MSTGPSGPPPIVPITTSGCDWPVNYTQCGPCDALTEANRATFEGMAIDYLWNWTGRHYGVCEVVARPCREECVGSSAFFGRGPYLPGPGWMGFGLGGTGWWPVLIAGEWTNVGCGTCIGRCSCFNGAKSLRLPGPIIDVTKVTLDGATLADTAYKVEKGRILSRIDGDKWPKCQDLLAPVTEDNTWSVEYTRGVVVPQGGQVAAGVLACELAKAACNDSSCRLPARIQSITRQGVTIAVLDNFADMEKGRTGIWLIDSWVTSLTGPRRGGQVYSVDVSRPRHR